MRMKYKKRLRDRMKEKRDREERNGDKEEEG